VNLKKIKPRLWVENNLSDKKTTEIYMDHIAKLIN